MDYFLLSARIGCFFLYEAPNKLSFLLCLQPVPPQVTLLAERIAAVGGGTFVLPPEGVEQVGRCAQACTAGDFPHLHIGVSQQVVCRAEAEVRTESVGTDAGEELEQRIQLGGGDAHLLAVGPPAALSVGQLAGESVEQADAGRLQVPFKGNVTHVAVFIVAALLCEGTDV